MTRVGSTGDAETGCRQRLKAEPGEQSRGPRVPRVGNDKGTRPFVQFAKRGRLFRLCVADCPQQDEVVTGIGSLAIRGLLLPVRQRIGLGLICRDPAKS